MILRYRLTTRELSRAMLVTHYRARRWGAFRIFGGPLLVTVGLVLRALAGGRPQEEGLGMFFVFYGLYYGLRPFLTAWLRARMRSKDGLAEEETELAIDDDGVRVRDASTSTELAWDAIVEAGASDDHFYVAVRGGVRFIVPTRVVKDAERFAAPFVARKKWKV